MDASELPINSSYAYWAPDSTFRLVNVPWDSGYRNVVEFADRAAQDAWFDGLPGVTVARASMQRYGAPVRVDVPFNRASLHNYLVVEQPYGFDTTRRYYYFITDCMQVNANVTQLNVYLDVWQTYLFDRTWGQAYVERGHIGVANENQMRLRGREYLDIPEGLDCGADYRIVDERTQHYMSWNRHDDEYIKDTSKRMLVIVSTTDLTTDPGTVENPRLRTATGSWVSTIVNGAAVYFVRGNDHVFQIWNRLSQYSWVSQGILGIWLVPDIVADDPKGDYGIDYHLFGKDDYPTITLAGNLARWQTVMDVKDFVTMDNLGIPDRYRHLRKFLMYPYCAVELSMTNGSAVTLKPQYFKTDSIALDSAQWYGAPSPRMWVMPRDYNGGERFSVTVGMDDYPRLVGVSSNSITWLASNANSLRHQQQSAEWSQNKTMMGVNNAYAQANESAALSQRQTGRANALSSNLTALSNATRSNENLMAVSRMQNDLGWADANAALGLGNGVANTVAAPSGPASAALGVYNQASGAISGYAERHSRFDLAVNQANASTALANDSATAAQSLQAANAGASTDDAANVSRRFADQNRALGQAVAQGDYANTIAGINAKVQDAQLMPPSTVGTLGGEAALVALDQCLIQLRLRRVGQAAMRDIGEVWLRYGYYVQRYMTLPARLRCMSHFAYWKCQDVELVRGAMPEEFRLTLKGILEKGVTVWSDPDIIATCDRGDNAPLPGYRY